MLGLHKMALKLRTGPGNPAKEYYISCSIFFQYMVREFLIVILFSHLIRKYKMNCEILLEMRYYFTVGIARLL